MKVEVAHGNIMSYTGKLIQQFRPLADKKEIHITFTTTPFHWEIHFDTDKWHKIIYNLLSNSVKFTREGGNIAVTLEQLQEAGQDYIYLTIKDTGIGIAKASLPHIFDRFYQGNASATRMQSGTGIGLALVKELVAMQNGSLAVESEPGKGSVFMVKLPLAEAKTVSTIPVIPETEIPLQPLLETLSGAMEVTTGSEQEKPSGEKLELLIIEIVA